MLSIGMESDTLAAEATKGGDILGAARHAPASSGDSLLVLLGGDKAYVALSDGQGTVQVAVVEPIGRPLSAEMSGTCRGVIILNVA